MPANSYCFHLNSCDFICKSTSVWNCCLYLPAICLRRVCLIASHTHNMLIFYTGRLLKSNDCRKQFMAVSIPEMADWSGDEQELFYRFEALVWWSSGTQNFWLILHGINLSWRGCSDRFIAAGSLVFRSQSSLCIAESLKSQFSIHPRRAYWEGLVSQSPMGQVKDLKAYNGSQKSDCLGSSKCKFLRYIFGETQRSTLPGQSLRGSYQASQ